MQRTGNQQGETWRTDRKPKQHRRRLKDGITGNKRMERKEPMENNDERELYVHKGRREERHENQKS